MELFSASSFRAFCGKDFFNRGTQKNPKDAYQLLVSDLLCLYQSSHCGSADRFVAVLPLHLRETYGLPTVLPILFAPMPPELQNS